MLADKRTLPKDLGNGLWHLRGRLRAIELVAAYFEAAKLISHRSFCVLKRRPDGANALPGGQNGVSRALRGQRVVRAARFPFEKRALLDRQ